MATIGKDALYSKYVSENWPERLAKCRRIALQDQDWTAVSGQSTVQKRGHKYLDDNSSVIAVVFEYKRADGSTHISVRMLRDGDTVYHV